MPQDKQPRDQQSQKREAVFPDSPDRPDKFVLETRLIELGAALTNAQLLFKGLERDFYLAAFGRYDE